MSDEGKAPKAAKAKKPAKKTVEKPVETVAAAVDVVADLRVSGSNPTGREHSP